MKMLLVFLSLFCSFSAYCVRTVHVFVALCDNKNQGIVPVPASVGNGQNPATNLYWGATYGVKTFLSRSPDWKLVKSIRNPSTGILERSIFQGRDSSTYVIADAYDGAKIRWTVENFLRACAGILEDEVVFNGHRLLIGRSADLLAYIGHDGLMDFDLDYYFTAKDKKKRKAVILACSSKIFFNEPLQAAGAQPLIWTSGLCCPEAYTLEAILKGWINGEKTEQIHLRAAKAYDKYQKCGLEFAKNLFRPGTGY